MQKILIVEDDIDIQDILKNHLIDAGYEVAVASDGVAGIAMFGDTIDLVLLDIMLPKIDGYGVCEVIRKRSQVPIIMLTALSDEENQLRGFEQQIDDYIPKPFSPKILLCKIAAILRRRTVKNQNQSLLTYKELSMDVDGFHVILMVFLLSLLCAWLYTRYITRPIVQLSKISKQMAELDFSGQCGTGREDELGCLAQNLNSLSASLSTALNDLQTANQQLKTDIEKEQELERQRVDFFSAASHELKTPLTILKGHLAGMLNGVCGYENHIEYMERSLAVVNRMEKLVKELLYVSKAEETQKSEYKTINFAEIFRVQIATVTDLLEEKEQCLEANIPTRLYCEVEQAQMERAIQNILVNATHYSPSGELIRISLSETHGTIRGEIENKGVHVHDDSIPHLFEVY